MSDVENSQFSLKDLSLNISSFKEKCSASDVNAISSKLDENLGCMLTSRYEYPGRYTRWDIGFVNPPITLEAVESRITIFANNVRGEMILPVFANAMSSCDFVKEVSSGVSGIEFEIDAINKAFMEEDRSKMPHVMNVIRHLRDRLKIDDENLGFYGAFGYDLGIDFMGVKRKHERTGKRDLILFFPDEIFVTDHANDDSFVVRYEFEIDLGESKASTLSVERSETPSVYVPKEIEPSRDLQPGEYAQVVETAMDYFARGDLFEVVPSQSFKEPCAATPSQVFDKLLEINPAPYGALMNLGKGEWTVSASPEMFVRVDGRRVESCPIAGTIARGTDAITDAEQIKTLLDSDKEKSELTMCTDVDRNDKSRVCIPQTIDVIGRRQIEMYSRLIHTVDHVEGYLEQGYDSIDAFLTHMWAVTVTGAPKMWAMNFIEEYEKSPRRFYGGSMGFIGLNGSMNTGLMLRTIHFEDGTANIRVGATLLFDSDPQMEERETELKASAMLDVVRHMHSKATGENVQVDLNVPKHSPEIVVSDKEDEVEDLTDMEVNSTHDLDSTSRVDGVQVLLIDCEDSFVHTLAGYFRIGGARVHTKRIGFTQDELQKTLEELNPDLVCLSPGPGSPTDFGLFWIIEKVRELNIPIFGVCLGLQALVEYFGGELEQLETPMHGKPSQIEVLGDGGIVFSDLEKVFEAGRYHSLIAKESKFPEDDLIVTARTKDDGVIMGIQHKTEPIAAVQFHPESIMTKANDVGMRMIQNVLDNLAL